MVNGTDVTITSGNSIVFASALSNGDVVDLLPLVHSILPQ